MNKQIPVTAAILIKNGQVMIAKRKPTNWLGSKWEFPGGKIEPGETPEQCLAREIQEEFGIGVKVGEFFCDSAYVYERGAINLLAYMVEWVSGELEVREHEEVKWVPVAQLNQYDFLPADLPIVAKLRSEFIDIK